MSTTDWIILFATVLSIVAYGIWKGRRQKTLDSFLRAERKLPWFMVGLSVMATQASAITFLSAPGQAFTEGLGFVQFYFGLPLAMIVLCVAFVPRFRKLNIFTAYEYLEQRFDLKTRVLTSLLFLIQRGISTGITMYAPALVLSAILGVPVFLPTLFIGLLVILYTTTGGIKAVSHTQTLQMGIIFGGLFAAGIALIALLPETVSLSEALKVAGNAGKMNAVDFTFDPGSKYNIWSGIIGGFFLQLSYFGTDQSQVGRYLTGSSVGQSRLGLMMNGFLKIPMQFFILMLGVLVFSFYQYHPAPVNFNPLANEEAKALSGFEEIQYKLDSLHFKKQAVLKDFSGGGNLEARELLKKIGTEEINLKRAVKKQLEATNPGLETEDSNYVFLHFVTHHLPVGMIGLLVAIIFLASMGATAGGLNALASTTVVDVYARWGGKVRSEKNKVMASRLATAGWGVISIAVALYAGKLGNLIEVVNILGSLFYGTILGIFLVGFFIKEVKGTAVFMAALVAELVVVTAWKMDWMAFLWLNVLGCLLVIAFSLSINWGIKKNLKPTI